jgi:hypothetical protein
LEPLKQIVEASDVQVGQWLETGPDQWSEVASVETEHGDPSGEQSLTQITVNAITLVLKASMPVAVRETGRGTILT